MRSVQILLLVSALAFVAYSQNSCASPAPTGCSSCTGLAALSFQCTSCSSGYLLTGTVSGCASACGTGCWYCTNNTVCLTCAPSYVLWSTTGVCVALGTGCTAGNATSATVSTCSACWANYTLNTGVCVACGGTTTTSANSITWSPVTNCMACTAIAATTTNLLITGFSITGTWVTCTSCASGYILLTKLAQSCSTATPSTTVCGPGISTPECWPIGTAVTNSTGTLTGSGNWVPSITPAWAATAFGTSNQTSCNMGSVNYTAGVQATSVSAVAGFVCTGSATTWCPTTAQYLGGTNCCGATAITPTGVSNCAGGVSTGTTAAVAQCTTCTNSSFYLNATAVGNGCVANNANCITQVSATNCTVAAAGYTIVNGIVTACSNTTTSCTGGILSTQILLATGATMTGTAVSGCAYHNASSACVLCAAFQTSIQNCTACPSNCVNCTMSSGATSCSVCNSGYNSWSNGSCLVACANGTNRSSNGSCAYGKNMIASAVAFASLVFYYIF